MKRDDIIRSLADNPNLSGVPVEQLEWLVDQSELAQYKSGEFVFKKDDPANQMFIILKGVVRLYFLQKGAKKDFRLLERHAVSGEHDRADTEGVQFVDDTLCGLGVDIEAFLVHEADTTAEDAAAVAAC